MKYLDLTLDTAPENLACDEAFLDLSDQGSPLDLLRCWESPSYFVAVGYANRVEHEVHLPSCEAMGIPVYRRCSGGGTVLQGPGSLSYSLVLDIESNPELKSVTGTNRFIMERHRDLIATLLGGAPVQVEGHTDLSLARMKFSGNAQRRRQNCLLFHGTFLLDFDLPLIQTLLRFPPRQPDYRRDRSHLDFVTNLALDRTALKEGLRRAWRATEPAPDVPRDRIEALIRDKYGRADWNNPALPPG